MPCRGGRAGPNNGLALVSSGASFAVDSKENAFTSHEPQLVLTLVDQGPAGATGPQGPQGVAGPVGAAGPQGATGAAGQGFNFRGVFNAATAYNAYDLVSYNGSSYVTLAAIPADGVTPDLSTAWQVFAAAGAAGSQGPQGVAGPAGPPGPTGPTGPQGIQGPQGPAGTNGTNGQGFNVTGPFNPATAYNAFDLATYNGSSYVATVAVPAGGTTPDQNPSWLLLAQAGAPGTAGATGPAGPTGPTGPQGPAGPPGPQGPAGTVPTDIALVDAANAFTTNQTVSGNVTITGTNHGVVFPDGSKLTTANVTGVPAGYLIEGTTPTVPSGFSAAGEIVTAGGPQSLPPLPAVRVWSGAVVESNGKVLVFGGETGAGATPIQDVEEYDPGTLKWTSVNSAGPAYDGSKEWYAVLGDTLYAYVSGSFNTYSISNGLQKTGAFSGEVVRAASRFRRTEKSTFLAVRH